MEKQRIFILIKELPNLPIGRKFISTYDNTYVFSSMTNDEVIEGKLQHYKFSMEVIEKNIDWFKEETN